MFVKNNQSIINKLHNCENSLSSGGHRQPFVTNGLENLRSRHWSCVNIIAQGKGYVCPFRELPYRFNVMAELRAFKSQLMVNTHILLP